MKKRPALVIEPRFRIVVGRSFVFGPGKAAMLEQIQKTGSIAQAAQAMAMSYMRAWMLVKSMNRGFAKPLVNTARGGRRHGGAKLTATGSAVLQHYRKIEAQSLTASGSSQKKLARLLSA